VRRPTRNKFPGLLPLPLSSLKSSGRTFLFSVGWITLSFALSKVLSSVAVILVARIYGPEGFARCQMPLIAAQVFNLLVLLGMNNAVIRYGAAKAEPAAEVTFGLLANLGMAVFVTAATLLFLRPISGALGLEPRDTQWALVLGIAYAFYSFLTGVLQATHRFKARGFVEIAFSVLILPGLLLGNQLKPGSYEAVLLGYFVSYVLPVPALVWLVRGLLRLSRLQEAHRREMAWYGTYTCLASIGYLLTFVAQPLQVNHYLDDSETGIYRLYCQGSIGMAAFATTAFGTVFFPKASMSQNRRAVWGRLVRLWLRLWPLILAFFAALLVVVVYLSGHHEYPLKPGYLALFSLASLLICIQSTFGQLLAAIGVNIMKWALLTSLLSGLINYVATMVLVPRLGIAGAAWALILNYAVTLLATWSLRGFLKDESPPAKEATAESEPAAIPPAA